MERERYVDVKSIRVWVTEALGNDANHEEDNGYVICGFLLFLGVVRGFLFASKSMPKPEKKVNPWQKKLLSAPLK